MLRNRLWRYTEWIQTMVLFQHRTVPISSTPAHGNGLSTITMKAYSTILLVHFGFFHCRHWPPHLFYAHILHLNMSTVVPYVVIRNVLCICTSNSDYSWEYMQLCTWPGFTCHCIQYNYNQQVWSINVTHCTFGRQLTFLLQDVASTFLHELQ